MNQFQITVVDSLAQYIAQETGEVHVDASLDLIQSGLLDSLLIMGLVAFIDGQFGVRAEPADISPARFRSIATLADWITCRHAQIARAA